MRRLAFLRACPAYFGGKPGMLAGIFRHLPEPQHCLTLVDAFTGGGSIALFAKARGYRVLTNDLATRAHLIGCAFIENTSLRLTSADTTRLHVSHESDGPIERLFAPEWFLPKHARWLDNALAAARAVACETRRALLLVLLIHVIFRLRPYDTFSRPAMPERMQQVLEQGSHIAPRKIEWWASRSPKRLTDGLLGRVNAGVFSNGEQNEAHRKDVLDFLAAVHGDIAYFDPPYWGSNSYERLYGVLDQILEGRDEPLPVSKFNQAGAEQLLHQMLEAADHIPVWALSFGGGKLSADDVLALVQKHRPARLVPVTHRYRFGTAHRKARKDEILVIAAQQGEEGLLP